MDHLPSTGLLVFHDFYHGHHGPEACSPAFGSWPFYSWRSWRFCASAIPMAWTCCAGATQLMGWLDFLAQCQMVPWKMNGLKRRLKRSALIYLKYGSHVRFFAKSFSCKTSLTGAVWTVRSRFGAGQSFDLWYHGVHLGFCPAGLQDRLYKALLMQTKLDNEWHNWNVWMQFPKECNQLNCI